MPIEKLTAATVSTSVSHTKAKEMFVFYWSGLWEQNLCFRCRFIAICFLPRLKKKKQAFHVKCCSQCGWKNNAVCSDCLLSSLLGRKQPFLLFTCKEETSKGLIIIMFCQVNYVLWKPSSGLSRYKGLRSGFPAPNQTGWLSSQEAQRENQMANVVLQPTSSPVKSLRMQYLFAQ